MIKEYAETVQRMVAGFAEATTFSDRNPRKAKAAIAKIMRNRDEEVLRVAYNFYTEDIVDRHMIVPAAAAVAEESIELQRNLGAPVKRRPEDLYDNWFAYNLEKSGFMKELWGK